MPSLFTLFVTDKCANFYIQRRVLKYAIQKHVIFNQQALVKGFPGYLTQSTRAQTEIFPTPLHQNSFRVAIV